MTTRHLLFWLLLLGLFCAPSSAEDNPPNIVMIISDDQAWTDYGFMGHDTIQTPSLDQLARESVLFRRGYVPTSLCRPSLMTLVTGHYAHLHGVTGNDPSARTIKRNSDEYRQQRQQLINFIDRFETLPELLASRGYVSHQSGKWWEGNFRRGGFTAGMTRGFPEPGGRHGDDGLKIGRDNLDPITRFIDDSVEGNKPFFVWYAPFLPHTPHTPPARLLRKYQSADRPDTIARYYAMCEWFDETCGQLLKHIDQRGIRENTLVVYVTDNGWIQNPEKRGYAPRSKQTPYEGGVRTPIMFRWPGQIQPADRPELVSSIDLVPTLLAVAGIQPHPELPGLDLSPHLKTARPIERKAILGEGFAHDIADIADPEASLLYRWCIEDEWKLILTYDGEVNRYQTTHPRTEKRPQLFHLGNDPTELNNVAADHPDVVARLVKRIDGWYPVTKRKTIKSFRP